MQFQAGMRDQCAKPKWTDQRRVQGWGTKLRWSDCNVASSVWPLGLLWFYYRPDESEIYQRSVGEKFDFWPIGSLRTGVRYVSISSIEEGE
jgi:hypothetical protein